MEKIEFPLKNEWKKLAERPAAEKEKLETLVATVFSDIEAEGDKAVLKYAQTFDKVAMESLAVDKPALENAATQLSEKLKQAIQLAKSNIEKFHSAQKETKQVIETPNGVLSWRENMAIDKVGIYIPGGSAPLFSTVLMLGIPAMIAGCKEIILCTPPDKDGKINPAILYTASLIGITQIFCVGGIQAVAAMTFGTETIPAVYKIFGPGNQYVTAAKKLAHSFGVAIDMPAGPSEVLVIADGNAEPAFVAADLLSQAEHGADSQVILLSDSKDLIEKTFTEMNIQLENLPRKELAAAALLNSKSILLNSLDECIAFSNEYAPEHLIITTENYKELIGDITTAGSVFLGRYSCESLGDYASGTNHTLPTNGYARNYSGVSLDSFVKKITFQEVSAEGIKNIGPAVELMAEAEQLFAHKNAVTVRLKSL
ncbi:MAG: histidinol dehydrogenase [Bacteroidia bacterium]